MARWKAIGEATMFATKISPGEFVSSMPDIAQDESLYKAETYGFWTQYVAPIVLKGRLDEKYYNHALDLCDIIRLYLQIDISNAGISTREERVVRWVSDYEIRGITSLYDMPTLRRPIRGGRSLTAAGVEIRGWESVYDEPSILGRPVRRGDLVDTKLLNQLTKYLGPILTPPRSASDLKDLVDVDSVVRYGRVRIAGGGDRIRTGEGSHSSRDNSFVRYVIFPDANAHFCNRDDEPVQQVNYGQLQDIFYVELKERSDPDVGTKCLLGRVLPCGIRNPADATKELVEYQHMATASMIIHLNSIEACNSVHTLFTNGDNAADEATTAPTPDNTRPL
ncbi:hypothetical protein FRC10_009732 [Ceratobasidium sp. 414]|nr:hypothetical protein FRC10_009732 [Ceratobasidium sp. 414]